VNQFSLHFIAKITTIGFFSCSMGGYSVNVTANGMNDMVLPMNGKNEGIFSENPGHFSSPISHQISCGARRIKKEKRFP
jgi:hypothetical protein